MPDMAQALRRKLTPEDKEQILALSREGAEITSIAKQLNLHGQVVNGFVSTARKRNLLAPRSPQEPPPQTSVLENFMPEIQQQPAAGAPVAGVPPPMHSVPQPQFQPQVTRNDGFSGGRPVLADPGGFTSPSSELRWTVERIVPPDGVLGTHYGPFTLEELGQVYGEGSYKVTKNEPGKQVGIEFFKKIGSSYGAARSPKVHQTQSQQAQPGQAQPQAAARPFFQRPWDPNDPQAGQVQASPYYSPFYRADFARPAPVPAADSSVATEAIRQMGLQNQKLLEQQALARQNGPENQIVQLMQAQQDLWNKRWEEERRQEQDRRSAEQTKWEQRQHEERDRWDRERTTAKDAHDRDLIRIKADSDARLAEIRTQAEERERLRRTEEDARSNREATERKFLLDLEDKRLGVVKLEADIHQKRLESELIRARDEMTNLQNRTSQELRDSRAATDKAISASQGDLEERFQEREAQLDKEYKLREKGQEREHELQREILSIQKEQVQRDSGDQLFNMIQTFIKEASKGLEKLVDLKKIEALTPEAQAAAIQRGAIDGNVMGGPAPAAQAPQPQPEAAQGPQRQAAAAQKPAGNGSAAAPAPAASSADTVEALVKRSIETPEAKRFFSGIVEEWSLHVDVGNNPSVFATLYLEMMRDENNGDMRRFCTLLFTLISARPWARMHAFLKPYLTENVAKIFEKPEAEAFYEAFRAMVYHQMDGYWQQIMMAAKQREAQQPAQPQAAQPQASPAQVPVEPEGAGATPQATVEDAPPEREPLHLAQ